MNVALWISGKLDGQVALAWAKEHEHVPVCFLSMDGTKISLQWASNNLDTLKKVSDANKLDLLFKSVKKTGDDNFNALDALLSYAKNKYGAEAVAVSKEPAVAHPISNAARRMKMKTVLMK
ncbi:MAG: hypothetical protein AABY01_05115 [Nanoarchaeota archaeon]